jgi:AcrR family transcriptional regulator
VSLREIAREADVNFGLVYQYVGTREQLVAEVLRRTAADAAALLAETSDFDGALRMILSVGTGDIGRILAWAVLEGHDVTALVGLSPALSVLAERARQDGAIAETEVDASLVAAIVMVFTVGWRLFGSAALAAAGLDPTRQAEYGERVAQYVRLLGTPPVHMQPAGAPRPRGRGKRQLAEKMPHSGC